MDGEEGGVDKVEGRRRSEGNGRGNGKGKDRMDREGEKIR